MHTEIFCKTLSQVDPVMAIRAVQEAWLQLSAHKNDVQGLDDKPALKSLEAILVQAGHLGFCEVTQKRIGAA